MKNYIAPIIKQLQATTSRLEKESILNANAGNGLLRDFFESAKNPFRTYGIKKIPEYVSNNDHIGIPLEQAIMKLDLFETRKLTGNRAIKKLGEILTNLSAEDADLFEKIITGDPDCGVSTSILNKVWPNLIPQQIYMGATPMSDDAINRLDFISGVFAQNKEDGLFMSTSITKDITKHFGRSGKEYDFGGAFKYLEQYLAEYRIDGEIRVYNDDFSGFLPRKLSNGYTNKFQVGKPQKDLDVNKLCYIIWDVVPLKDSLIGECKVPYFKRFSAIHKITNLINESIGNHFIDHDIPVVRCVQTKIVHSVHEAKEFFKLVSAKGEEGLILKDRLGEWSHGKPSTQVKLKNVTPIEMKIVGFSEHKKKKGRLGAFMLESADGIIKTNCGSGLDEDESIRFWNEQSEMMNGVVSVKFESIIWKEDSNVLSLNLPIFDEYRVDKDIANTTLEIIKEYEGTKGCECEKEIYDILDTYK